MKIKKSKIFVITMLLLCFTLSVMQMKVFAATEIGNANIGSVNFDYVAGDVPKASANVTYDEAGNYDHYKIEYECWQEMEEDATTGESVPVKFWYSDESKYTPVTQDKKIITFEEGKTYMYSISLKANDGDSFKDECTVKINNDTIKKENVMKNGNVLFVTAVKTIKPISKKPVELIEITDVTTNFKVGDKPVFTGKAAEPSLYEIDNEGWSGADEMITSSEYWNNRYKDWGNAPLTSFKANTEYSYAIYVKLTDEAVKNGYYFDKDKTKLSINGKVITMDPKFVSIDENNNVVAQFGEVLKMTPTESKTEQTKNETNHPKTGDNIITSVMLFGTCIAAIVVLTIVKREKARE